MFDKKVFADRVKMLRVQANVKQSDVAEAIGLSHKLISAVELGNRLLSMEALIDLAEYFNVPIDYLVGRTDNPKGGIE